MKCVFYGINNNKDMNKINLLFTEAKGRKLFSLYFVRVVLRLNVRPMC